MVSLSPRLRDSLDYEDPEQNDPRLTWGFRSLSLEGSDYHQYEEPGYDRRPSSATPDSPHARRNQRQKQYDKQFRGLTDFQYNTVADGDSFRLIVIKPGYGRQPIDCQLVWEDSRAPKRSYTSLSYCWETLQRDTLIICDGYKFSVTKNLWQALQCLRSPTKKVLIWIDQICINQDDIEERAQQVAIMKRIFLYSKQVIVWLGEERDNSSNLCEYAKKMRSRDGPRPSLSKLLAPRQLEVAVQKLLERPWFQRVWVIPEVCLAPAIRIRIGSSTMTWESLTRLLRDTPTPQSTGFTKHIVLPGNARQRVSILSQMMLQQKESRLHANVCQLLILAKSSHATEMRDKVYAFYGMTIISTTPDYRIPIDKLYIDIAHNYVNNIEAAYDAWHKLSEVQRTFQLMSILYSAGTLHQKEEYHLPSWVPDWSFQWHLAPTWLKASALHDIAKDDTEEALRTEHRAGGSERDHFEVSDSGLRLRLSALLVDEIVALEGERKSLDFVDDRHGKRLSILNDSRASSSERGIPVPRLTTAPPDQALSISAPTSEEIPLSDPDIPITIAYMRQQFQTKKGYTGVATQGIQPGDMLAILLGGDVPVILRRVDRSKKQFSLLCEAFVQSSFIMSGDYLRSHWTITDDIELV